MKGHDATQTAVTTIEKTEIAANEINVVVPERLKILQIKQINMQKPL